MHILLQELPRTNKYLSELPCTRCFESCHTHSCHGSICTYTWSCPYCTHSCCFRYIDRIVTVSICTHNYHCSNAHADDATVLLCMQSQHWTRRHTPLHLCTPPKLVHTPTLVHTPKYLLNPPPVTSPPTDRPTNTSAAVAKHTAVIFFMHNSCHCSNEKNSLYMAVGFERNT